MTRDGCKLKETGVRLLLSSRAEMQKVIETARHQTVSVFQLNTPTPVTVPPPAPQIHVPPPPVVANPQLLLAQQMLSQQIPFLNHQLPPNIQAVMAANKLDFAGQQQQKHQLPLQQQQQHSVAQISSIDRNRNSNDKKVTPRDRRRDSRSRSRERHSRGRSRSRSNSRDRGRRNRSRSRSRDRTSYRRRREKRSYSRDYDSDDDSSSRGSKRRSITPPKSSGGGNSNSNNSKDGIQIWENQPALNFRSMVYNSTSNGNGSDNSRGSNFNRHGGGGQSNNNQSGGERNSFGAFQKLRERRNESSQGEKRNESAESTAIDLTEDDHNCCVMISNLDKTTGYGEIRRFFQGLPVRQNGLKMINSNLGKRTGVAYVRFHRPESRKFSIMRSGQVLNGAKVEVVTLGDEEFEQAVDSYRPPIGPTSQLSHLKPSVVNPQPPGAALPTPFDKIVFTCLKVTDVPSLTTEQDVMKVFSDYGLMHIIIAKDKHKKNCAFLKLNRAEDAKKALLEKSNLTMGHKNVTVTMCSEAVFEEVMNSTAIEETSGYGSQDDAMRTVEDEEKGMTEEQMQEKEHEAQEKINITRREKERGSRWGEKVVEQQAPPAINLSLLMGGNSIGENNSAKKGAGSRWTSGDQQEQQQQLNIPNQQSQQEIPAPLNPILSQLNLALPFLNSLLPQAAAALAKTDLNLGGQTQLQLPQQQQQQQTAPVSRDPRLKNLGSNNNAPQSNQRSTNNDPRANIHSGHNNNRPTFNPGLRHGESDCVVISNLESSSSDLDVASFFSKAGIVPLRVHILLNTAGAPSGDAFVEFSNSNDANTALLQNERLLGKNPVFVETIARAQVDEVLASFNGGGGSKGSTGPQQQQQQQQAHSIYNQFAATGINPALLRGGNPRMALQRPPFQGMAGGGGGGPRSGGHSTETNVLLLNNVPYRAGVEDIMEFFSGFGIRPEDVMRRFNDNGQATAEAKVRFKNPSEARKAFEEKKFTKMQGRTIYLEFDH